MKQFFGQSAEEFPFLTRFGSFVGVTVVSDGGFYQWPTGGFYQSHLPASSKGIG
jgi:hypothetical protein